ncbi:MAG: peptidase T [candidate division Zixibacteria bacterium]|nr:peptidase T [candidate division Zixibacteria bacterium]
MKHFKPAIIIHGGAWKIPKNLWNRHIRGCTEACQAGYKDLLKGKPATEAVCHAVKIMEDDPTFDAGVGALLNLLGEVELDAIIIDGKGVRSGAVAVVKNIKNPILLAQKVMQMTPHRLLAGKGAELFALKVGIPKCKTTDLIVGRELKRYEQLKKKRDFKIPDAFREKKGGTVGAVAIDINGNVASATSTGGVPKKLPGRVGDTPIIGSGAFADNRSGAASATGWGESIMKSALTKTACDYIYSGMTAQRAAKASIADLRKRWNGLGGIITVDNKGNLGSAYNTPQMAYAKITMCGKLTAGID